MWEAIQLLGEVKKQNLVSHSSVEVEYRVMAHATCGMWLKTLMWDFGFLEDGLMTVL